MPVYTTFSAVGEREDLSDIIVNIVATETPVFTAARKVKATGTLHEWQTQALAAAALNAQIQGADITSFSTLTATVRRGNYSQILNKNFFISDTLEVVSKAGRDSEYAMQAELKMKELARDSEFNIIRQTSASGDASTAATMDGLDTIITTNISTAAGSRSLTEELYNEMLQTVFDSGGNPNVTLVNGFQKRVISGFSGGSGTSRNIALTDRRLINSIDVYESDFGLQKIIIDRHLQTDRILLLEMALVRVAVLRATHHKPLPDDGGGPRGKVEHELTLEYGNEAAFGAIRNLSTS